MKETGVWGYLSAVILLFLLAVNLADSLEERFLKVPFSGRNVSGLSWCVETVIADSLPLSPL